MGERVIEQQGRVAAPADPVRRNFRAWVAYQFFFRIGWQFKMEATMVSGLVSFLSNSPAVIGIFSTASSTARALGPVLATPWIDRSPVKKRCLLWTWWIAAFFWGVGALYLWSPHAADKAQTLRFFFLCYTAFFLFLGCTDVAAGALLGKIIPADRRGRALSVTHTLAGPVNVLAILIVYSLVRSGAFPAPRNYALTFTITAVLFFLAGVGVLFTREKPSATLPAGARSGARLVRAWRVIRSNRNFRILLFVQLALAVGGSGLCFYTAYGRQAGSMRESSVVLATVFQVFWQAVAASWLGRVADRRGNRAVICALLWVEVLTPVTAVIAATFFPGTAVYLLVYCLVGARFPVFQLLVNYLLEIIPEADHALALGTSNTLTLVTVAAPMLLGAVIGRTGYPIAMLLASSCSASAAIAALSLRDPRVGKG